mgnify:CR=1 FL=1
MTKTELRRTSRSLPIALLRARETVMGPVRNMLAASGVNEQKWRVLRVLDETGPLDQSLLAEKACLQLPSLTRILRALSERGLIKQVDCADARRHMVTLTEAGTTLFQKLVGASENTRREIDMAFGEEKMMLLLDMLNELRIVTDKLPDSD